MIRFENVSKNFKNHHKVLKNMNFTVKKGELIVLMGPSGCGKTTILKMINRLMEPTQGEIFINNKNIKEINPTVLRRQQGYVVKSIGLFPHMTIKENIELIPNLLKKKEGIIPTDELMKMVGLQPQQFLYCYPKQLSIDQQQRISIARAFVMNPEIILMDEPFKSLESSARLKLQNQLVKIQHHLKKTIIFVTDNIDEAIKIADRICIINKGNILQYDTPEKILKEPTDDFVENFIGKHKMWTQPENINAMDICINTPITASCDITVLKASQIMQSQRVDSLLIVDKNDRLEGIMSIDNLHSGIRSETLIKEVMNTNPIYISPNDNILSVLEHFDNGVSLLPVVDKNHTLCGLITRSCLTNTILQQYIRKDI